MSDLKTYFAAPGRAETPSAAEAGDLAVRFPWFLPGRILRETLTGESDPRVALTAPWRAESSLRRAVVDASALTQLLLGGDHRPFPAGRGPAHRRRRGRTRGGGRSAARTGRRRRGGHRGAGRNLSRSRPSGQVRGDLSQIKFAKSRKKCLLCRTYWQNRKQY